jgi:hypothetical protein
MAKRAAAETAPPATDRPVRLNFTLLPEVAEKLRRLADADARRDGTTPNLSGTVAKLIAQESARRERALVRRA